MPRQYEERGSNFLPDFMATALVISQQTHGWSAHRSMLQWSNKAFAANMIPRHGSCQHEPKAVLMVLNWKMGMSFLPYAGAWFTFASVFSCTWKIWPLSISLAQQGHLFHSNIPFFFPAEICYSCQPPGLALVGSPHSFLNFPRDCGTELLTSASSLDQHHLLLLFQRHPYCLQVSIQLPYVLLLCPHWHFISSSRPHMWCCDLSLAANDGISPRTAMIFALDPVGLQHQNTSTGSLLWWQWEAIEKRWYFTLGRWAENRTSSLTILIS